MITPEQRRPIVMSIMVAIQDTLANLYGRWQDEKEYEDFAEYAKVMTDTVLKHAPTGTKVIKTSKRPFGIVIHIPGFPFHVMFKVTSKTIGWTSVKGLPVLVKL